MTDLIQLLIWMLLEVQRGLFRAWFVHFSATLATPGVHPSRPLVAPQGPPLPSLVMDSSPPHPTEGLARDPLLASPPPILSCTPSLGILLDHVHRGSWGPPSLTLLCRLNNRWPGSQDAPV